MPISRASRARSVRRLFDSCQPTTPGRFIGIVLLFLVVAAEVPATRAFLRDARAQIDAGRLAYELAVSIVVLTVLLRSSRPSGTDSMVPGIDLAGGVLQGGAGLGC
jgi:hypothetical protein